MATGEKAYLYLEDGTRLEGIGFGAKGTRRGELVFTTSMNGYPESLTDPSYKGQILIVTHPLVGNYGVPRKQYNKGILKNFESPNIMVEGLVVSELTHGKKWNSVETLDQLLRREKVPGIQGVDTRALTQKVRDKGVMMCLISYGVDTKTSLKRLKGIYETTDYVSLVSPKKPILHGTAKESVVVVDFGVKHGILDNLASLGYRVVRLPHTCSHEQIMSYDPVGIVYSNGPGNPNLLKKEAETMRRVFDYKKPVLAICLGHQLATIALGGTVKKMKFGHRAINKAVVDVTNGKSYITTHNHGYASYKKGIPKGCELWFLSPDDGVVEGMKSKKHNLITTQFHPEARPGTNDAKFIFSIFQKMIKNAPK